MLNLAIKSNAFVVLFLIYKDAATTVDTDVPVIVAVVPLYRTTSMLATDNMSSPGPLLVNGAMIPLGVAAPTPIAPLIQDGNPTKSFLPSFPVAINEGIF